MHCNIIYFIYLTLLVYNGRRNKYVLQKQRLHGHHRVNKTTHVITLIKISTVNTLKSR